MGTLAAILVGVIVHLSLANIAYDVILAMINRGAAAMLEQGHPAEQVDEVVAHQRSGLFAACMFWPITFVTLGYVYYIAWLDTRE